MPRNPLSPPHSAVEPGNPERSLSKVEVLRAFAVSFLMLGSYYLVRPVRDDIGSEYHADLSTLFGFTFASMVLLSPLHGFLVGRIARRKLLPAIYALSSLCLVGFRIALIEYAGTELIEKSLYVFLAVYNLFIVSTFWSWMNDRFSERDARAWFGPVAVGGTIAAMTGSAITANLGESLGTNNLLLLSAGVLLLAGLLVALDRLPPGHERQRPTGGSPIAGARRVFSDPYLGGIAGYIFLMTIGGTVLYLEQSHIFAETFGDDRALRRTWLANMDLASNAGTLLFQIGVIGPWMLSKRITPVLATLPVFAVFAFPMLAWQPTLWTIVVLQVMTRIGKYGLAKPSREALYTVVNPEDRFKAKAFVDTVIYRGGDWMTTGLADQVLRLTGSFSGLAWAFAPLAVGWAILSIALGRTQARRADQSALEETS